MSTQVAQLHHGAAYCSPAPPERLRNAAGVLFAVGLQLATASSQYEVWHKRDWVVFCVSVAVMRNPKVQPIVPQPIVGGACRTITREPVLPPRAHMHEHNSPCHISASSSEQSEGADDAPQVALAAGEGLRAREGCWQ